MVSRDAATAPFELPPLPYDDDALAPVISAQTVQFHFGKHHKGYVDTLNKLVKGTPFAQMSLEEIIAETCGDEDNKKIFNNAAQIWNHTFYWNSLSPEQTMPGAALGEAIVRDFGSFEKLKAEIVVRAVDRFGSGYVWLTAEGQKLSLRDTPNADTPKASDTPCLLTIDVWEHAYYLDYHNARNDHVEAVVEKLLNWDFASQNFTNCL
jgi:Fe-Mn family superoxide dismutase